MRRVVQAAWAVVFLIITVGSLLPEDVALTPVLPDKIQHLVAYGALAGLTCWAYGAWARRAVVAMAALFVFGVAMEAAQSWVPGRESSLLDVVANTAGIVLGTTLATGLYRWLLARDRGASLH